jgi:hypothetical protein
MEFQGSRSVLFPRATARWRVPPEPADAPLHPLTWQLISVDASSGELVHRGIAGHDVFASESEAMDALRARFCGGKSIPALVHGHAFLGMVHTSTQVLPSIRHVPLHQGGAGRG